MASTTKRPEHVDPGQTWSNGRVRAVVVKLFNDEENRPRALLVGPGRQYPLISRVIRAKGLHGMVCVGFPTKKTLARAKAVRDRQDAAAAGLARLKAALKRTSPAAGLPQ